MLSYYRLSYYRLSHYRVSWRRLGLQRPHVAFAERDRARQRIGSGRRSHRCGFAWWSARAHDVLLDHDVGWTPDDEEMLHIVAANEDEAAPAVDRGLVDDGKPRLAPARGSAAEPPAAEPAQQPEGQRQHDQHDNQDEQDFETGLSFAE